MMRWLARAVPVLLACAAGARGEASARELLARAQAARARAETDLAEARQRHLEERKALAAGLQKAYDALAEARADAATARESLERLQTAAAGLERSAALAEHRAAGLIAQAAASAGATVKHTDSIARMERAIWEGYARRLGRIEAQAAAAVGTETVVDRDGTERQVAVIRFGGYAAYACGDSPATVGLLGVLPDGRKRLVGPYLDPAGAEALRAVGAGGPLAHLPVDVDGSLRGRTPAGPWTVRTWLDAGGLFIYPIIVAGAVGILLVLERLGYLFFTRPPASLSGAAIASVREGDAPKARELLRGSRTPTARVLLAGIDALEGTEDQRDAAVESALLAEAPRLERSLSLLAALAGVAPLLGLLGTVSGMISTFDTISATGTGSPRLLSGGISEALITTQLGLMVAIPLLLAHAGLRRWVERREAMLEHDAVRVLGIRNHDSTEAVP